MKQVKKLASLLLALVMVLSMTVTAFAAERDRETTDVGTITITNPVEGQDYTAYKIFSASYNMVQNDKKEWIAGSNYSYTIAPGDPWFEDVKNYCYSEYSTDTKTFTDKSIPADVSIYVGHGLTLTPNQDKSVYTVSYNSASFQVAMFAQYLNTKKAGKTGVPLTKQDDGTIGATKLPLGYYLVDTTLGSLCSLDTTNSEANIREKNDLPTVEKKVEVTSGTWGDENDTTINKPVNFKSTITVPEGSENLIFHDTMDAGLTFVYDTHDENVTEKKYPVRVTYEPKGASTAPEELVDGTHYEVVIAPKNDDGSAEGCTFHVIFKDAFYKKLGVGNNSVVVYYTAILNDQAKVVGQDGNMSNNNESKVSYSEKNTFTTGSTTKTYTYELPVFKFTRSTGNTANTEAEESKATVEVPLDDTHFKLYTRTSAGVYDKEVKLRLVDDGVGKGPVVNEQKTDAQAVYRVATDEEIEAGTGIVEEIVTNGSGKFVIKGLALGTYQLVETQAHNGYNMLPGPLRVTIQKNKEGQIEYIDGDGKVSNDMVRVLNNTGSELPSTGGIGTTIFYVVGSILLAGAAILLVTKKRMSAAR